MGKYSQFKKRVLEANLYLVGIGAGVAWTFGGSSIALDFACGGVAGIAYMSLLQHGTDSLALSGSPLSTMAKEYVPGQILSKVLASGFFRVAVVGIGVACAIYGTRTQENSSVQADPSQVQQLLAGAVGFLMYKLAIVGVLSFPPLTPWPTSPPSEN